MASGEPGELSVQAAGARPRPGAAAGALLRATRPLQWSKNLLVLAAPAAAVKLGDGDALVSVVLAVLSFTAASAGLYLVNDVLDRDEDRAHPVKRARPVAAGELAVSTATAAGVALIAVGLALAVAVGWAFAAVVAGFAALALAYSLGLRSVAVIEMGAVASGFILRALGGAVAVDVPVSRWFVIVASFGALFVVSGKRLAELISSEGGAAPSARVVLRAYSPHYLRQITTSALAVTIGAYCLWTFERAEDGGSPWFELSIAPFTLFLLRYLLLLERGRGETPEELVLRDRELFALEVAWCVLFAVAVYA